MSEDVRPLIAGVCGDPIGQSKSPVLFGHWFRTYGIAGSYTPLLIRAHDFRQVLQALPKAGFRGVNVTLPHKAAALAAADQVSDAAREIGAANTLTFSPEGSIHADNTDGFGFIENLRAGAPQWNPAAGPVTMLGAGGAARAGIHVLLQAGAPQIRLTNRTREKAEALADHFGAFVTVVDWADRDAAMDGAATIVNTTSLGMLNQRPLEISLDAAPQTALVTDMVYNPLKTDLLRSAEARGMPTVDGLGMLLHQARPGFHRWFGREAEVTPALRNAILETMT